MQNFSNITNIAIDAAKSSGKILRDGFRKKCKISNKEGFHNLVTEYDLKSEKNIFKIIKQNYPNHNILSEEAGLEKKSKNNIKWIIDPLDGTVNFAHNIPIFAVSIAAMQDNEIISGVIYAPILDELFIAEKNKGSFLNNKKIKISKTSSLENAILATGFPYNLNKNPDQCIENFTKMLKQGIPIRRLGAAALDLAYVAMGNFDGYWETGLGPWDVAAGKLIVEEAYGKVSNWSGKKFEISDKNKIVVSNGKIHDELLNIIGDKK